MNETVLTQQAMGRVNRLEEENVDLKAAIDDSFEVLLQERLKRVVMPNLSKNVLKSEILISKLETDDLKMARDKVTDLPEFKVKKYLALC